MAKSKYLEFVGGGPLDGGFHAFEDPPCLFAIPITVDMNDDDGIPFPFVWGYRLTKGGEMWVFEFVGLVENP